VKEVANVITTMFLEQIENPIGLHWKMEHDEGASLKSYVKGGITISETTSPATASKELQGNNGQNIDSTRCDKHTDLEKSSTKLVRTSKRQKRHLTSKKNYFL
jgi:hypothetical protein